MIFKQRILNALVDEGWEIIEEKEGEHWWMESLWSIKSIKQNWGFSVFIVFLIDPMDAKRIWAVSAVEDIPEERFSAENSPLLNMSKRNFEKKLNTFIQDVNTLRDRT